MKAKKLLAVLLALAVVAASNMTSALTSGKVAKAETTKTETTKTVSLQYAEAMAPGWNLGNTFDSTGNAGEESWGNPKVTKDLIKTIKEQGFNSIRMPLTVDGRVGSAPDYKIDSAYLARYAEVVQWALDEGLYVMINIHHDSWSWAYNIGSDDGTAMAKYKAVWTQLADCFKDYSDKVCFESLNEPYFTGDTEAQLKILDEVNKTFYSIVRTSGGKNDTRMLVLPTLNTNDSADRCTSLYNTIQSLNDKNIIATFHYYGYWPFSTNIAGTTTMDSTVVTELENAFNRVYSQFVANGIGVICGEYGLLGFDKSLDCVEHGEVLKYFEYINYYAKEKDIPLMLWDNGQHMGRTSLTWSDPSLYNMIKTSWTTRSSYSSSDRYFITDKIKSKDLEIKLTLNGNTLTDIYNGTAKLVKNKDYTYKNDTVILKGSYVNRVITKKYGINATLTMKFSAGADWDIYLTHYKTPVLGTGSGSTSGFVIPLQFNGSRLSTMEAINANGTGEGPQNWTTFKEYNYAFKVDYDNNTVTMTENFFKEAADGVITLKFHFQSGEILEYKIQKSGTIVTNAVAAPTLQTESVTLSVGKTTAIAINDLDNNAAVTYSSSNKSIATVSKTGKIKGIKAGTAAITVTVIQNNETYKLKVAVKVAK